MPNTASTITNTQPQMPFHFIPDEDAATHLSRHIRVAHQEFSKVKIETARNTALEKFKAQGEKNLPRKGIDDPLVTVFLNPQNAAHSSDAFEALTNEYIKLQKPRGDRSITSYVQSVQETTQNINKNFDVFLKKEKEAFHKHYA